MTKENTLQGLIIKAQSGFFTVETGQDFIVCQLRGKLKQGKATGDIAALGDRVQVTILEDGSGAIEEVEERRQAIVRLDPRPTGEYQQVLLANADQAVFVFACAHPDPKLRMLDRFLVIAEKQGVTPVIVANKIDLARDPKGIFGMYEAIGYRVIYTSIKTGDGIDELKTVLAGKISAFAGPSGAGKSSLLNELHPKLELEVGEVSKAMKKGKHTTVTRQMFPIEGGGYVADTPGWKSLALWDTEPEEIEMYFPELRDLVQGCQFSDCTHTHEPNCEVLAAVKEGRVNPERFDFLKIAGGTGMMTPACWDKC